MLKRSVRVTKRVPVNVIAFRWFGELKEGAVACNFKCCGCGGKLGARRFGAAMDGDRNQSMRLCEDCGIEAEASLSERVELTDEERKRLGGLFT